MMTDFISSINQFVNNDFASARDLALLNGANNLGDAIANGATVDLFDRKLYKTEIIQL